MPIDEKKKLNRNKYDNNALQSVAHPKGESMKTGSGIIGRRLDGIIVKFPAVIKDQTEPLANRKNSDPSFHENHNTVFMHVLRPNFKAGIFSS